MGVNTGEHVHGTSVSAEKCCRVGCGECAQQLPSDWFWRKKIKYYYINYLISTYNPLTNHYNITIWIFFFIPLVAYIANPQKGYNLYFTHRNAYIGLLIRDVMFDRPCNYMSTRWFVFHRRVHGTHFWFGGGGGGLRDLARIFSPSLARKSRGFARILLAFCRKMTPPPPHGTPMIFSTQAYNLFYQQHAWHHMHGNNHS